MLLWYKARDKFGGNISLRVALVFMVPIRKHVTSLAEKFCRVLLWFFCANEKNVTNLVGNFNRILLWYEKTRDKFGGKISSRVALVFLVPMKKHVSGRRENFFACCFGFLVWGLMLDTSRNSVQIFRMFLFFRTGYMLPTMIKVQLFSVFLRDVQVSLVAFYIHIRSSHQAMFHEH